MCDAGNQEVGGEKTEGFPGMPLDVSPDVPEAERRLRTVLHELSVHQEELRAQNEELLRVQEELESSRRQYIDLFDYAPIGYFMFDSNALVHKINITGADLLGVDRRRLIMKPFILYVQPEDRDLFRRHLRIVFETKGRHTQEIRLFRNGADLFHVRLDSVFTDDGTMSMCRTSVTDISDKKAAEAAISAYSEVLEKKVEERTGELKSALESLQVETTQRLRALEALREKEQLLLQQSRQAAMGEMINNIAHQWRQPLNALGLIIQSLSTEYEMGLLDSESVYATERRAMEIIYHMSRTIEDFRNYFKPDKDQVLFRLTEAVASAVSLVGDSLKSHHIELEVCADDDPEIHGYPNEFSQVLLNLLFNARDALLERETTDPKVMVRIRQEGGKAVVTIADNAGGIPEEIMDRIFDPYFTTKRPDQGTGVGLFMSKGIVEKNMRGRITAKNTDKGAEFRIEV